jgi:hypothetical protein
MYSREEYFKGIYMSEISIHMDHEKPDLSDGEIADKLQAERAAIPADVDLMIKEFLNVTNVTAAQRLLQAIDAFPDPEEGFNLWKTYYANGDDIDLKNALIKQHLPLSLTLSEMKETLADEERRGEKKSGLLRAAKNKMKILFACAAMKALSPKVNHIDNNTETAVNLFQVARQFVYCENKDGSPINDVLHSQLKIFFDTKLTASLEVLRGAANQALLPPDVVLAVRDQVLQKRFDLFDRLASQSFGHAENASREIANLSYSQIPKGQNFGIECEGFLPTGDETAKQSAKLYFRLKSLGFGMRFPFSSFVPKNDDVYEKWAITIDSSVVNPLRFVVREGKSGYYAEKVFNFGLEIVSPILEGANGGFQAQAVTETLKALGFRSNQTCGFHIHVDVSDASLEELKNIATAFAKNERRIDDFIDPQRRGEKAVFAKSVAGVDLSKIDAAKDVHGLIEVVNHGDRNSKFDITNLGVPGAPPTVQYRGEGGAGYIDNVMGYTVLMVNFTHMARTNPNLTVDEVLTKLRPEKAPEPSIPVPQESKATAGAKASL